MSRPTVAAHRRRNGSPSKIKPTRLLLTRESTRETLGCSDSTLIRLEKLGVLHPIKINPTAKAAKVFYRIEEVHKIASGETQSAEAE